MAHTPAVLVADDEPLLCDLIARLLAEAGYAVQTAKDGEEAIAWMEGVRFDLAIIDVIMPRRDGIETIIEIRRRWPACRVLALSGGGRIRSHEFLELAGKFGAHATLTKPLSGRQLIAAVQAVMQGA